MPILPSRRDRALCVQANAPGIRLVEPEAGAQQAFSAGTKKPLSGLFCTGGEGGIGYHSIFSLTPQALSEKYSPKVGLYRGSLVWITGS